MQNGSNKKIFSRTPETHDMPTWVNILTSSDFGQQNCSAQNKFNMYILTKNDWGVQDKYEIRTIGIQVLPILQKFHSFGYMLKDKKEMQISQMLRSFYPQPYLFYVDALTLYGLFYIRLNSSYILLSVHWIFTVQSLTISCFIQKLGWFLFSPNKCWYFCWFLDVLTENKLGQQPFVLVTC